MFLVFYSTSDVFEVEEIMNDNGVNCKVVPTPVTDKAYCGVCLEIDSDIDGTILSEYDYKIVER